MVFSKSILAILLISALYIGNVQSKSTKADDSDDGAESLLQEVESIVSKFTGGNNGGSPKSIQQFFFKIIEHVLITRAKNCLEHDFTQFFSCIQYKGDPYGFARSLVGTTFDKVVPKNLFGAAVPVAIKELFHVLDKAL